MDAERAAVVGEMRRMSRVRDAKRRSRGEIFTPVELAEEMLGAVPESLWSNRGARVLDPAAGFGVFPVLAFFRFMRGLAHKVADERARRRHIVENILVCVELDRGNASRCRRMLARLGGDGAAPQVHRTDFLEWGGDSFDLVMGNPPYNAEGLSRGGTLWVDFVWRSKALLRGGGMLLLIHPPGWRKPSGATRTAGDIWKSFRTEGSLVHLEIESARKPPFPEVDWYLWRRGRALSAKTTVVSGPDRSLRAVAALGKLPFIPGVVSRATLGILRKVVGSPGYSFKRDNRFRYPASVAAGPIPHVHFWDASAGDYRTLGLTAAQVRTMTGEKREPSFYAASKVVMSMNASKVPGELYPRHYPDGARVGLTSNVIYQEMPAAEAKACVRFFSSDLVRTVMKLCQYSASPNRKNETSVVNALKRPPPKAVRSEKALHDFYGLTASERSFVREFARRSKGASS